MRAPLPARKSVRGACYPLAPVSLPALFRCDIAADSRYRGDPDDFKPLCRIRLASRVAEMLQRTSQC